MFALINGVVLTGYQRLENVAVLIDGDRIDAIVPKDTLSADIPRYDLQGHILSAGFIDLQINGCGGVMFNNAPSIETLLHMQHTNLRTGTTSFLPTLISSSDAVIRQALGQIRSFMDEHPHQVLGMHLEGPYTNPKRKGIHPVAQLRHPDNGMIDWLATQSPYLKMVTLAPEENQAKHIRQLKNAGITVSIGHSAATYEQAMAGFAQGVSFATHLYNAMSPTANGREPGVVGAVYDQQVYAGIIADGYHVHWANVRTAKRLLGEKLCLVTDATAAATAPNDMTQFDFCGATVYISDGKCRDKNGTLGGSALTMNEGVRLLIDAAGLSQQEAFRMATLYPARAIGMDHQLGSIEPGKIANLVVIDRQYQVRSTLVNGKWTEE